jgi:hypothetical protein
MVLNPAAADKAKVSEAPSFAFKAAVGRQAPEVKNEKAFFAPNDEP